MTEKSSAIALIGNTPLLRLNNLSNNNMPKLFAKLEMLNPTGSIKDRIAIYMIESAEKNGLLKKGFTIIEASSGNTGTSLAMIARIKGYKCIITTPEKTSSEKIDMMRALGAEVRICPNTSADDSKHYINYAKQIANSMDDTYLVDQYNNHENVMAHYHHTAPEIWQQMAGKVDYLFACASSGGTISGIGKYLKEKNSNVKIVMVDPIGSIYYDYFKTGKINCGKVASYKIEGAGKDMLTSCMDFTIIDEIIQFQDEEAFYMCRKIAKNYGLLVGGTSGAAYLGATMMADKIDPDSNIVIIFPDSGLKYLKKIWGHSDHSNLVSELEAI